MVSNILQHFELRKNTKCRSFYVYSYFNIKHALHVSKVLHALIDKTVRLHRWRHVGNPLVACVRSSPHSWLE